MIILYSTPSCIFCHKAKEFFKEHNIEYTNKDVASDSQALDEMVKKSGQLGVPVIDIDGQIIVGFDRKKISELLNIK